MPVYTLDKYDFKKFLLAELPDTRQEDLIFWKNTIPMPVDLIYGIFEKRGELLRLYLDHIGAACLFAYAVKAEGDDWVTALEAQPTKDNRESLDELQQRLNRHLQSSGVLPMLFELAARLGLRGYSPSHITLAEALCHTGRKYKRLYLPASLRDIVFAEFPQVLRHIALSNWDMFSNVVADELGVYRMGFADAFSGIFNKLLDFIIRHITPGGQGGVSTSDITVRQQQAAPSTASAVLFDRVSDGSIWEPRYLNADTTLVVNQKHPFWELVRRQGQGAEDIIVQLLSSLAELENETVRDGDRKTIEVLRQDVSRRLRIQVEEAIR
jgi:hypothetical protein